jgi:hypothetical protein
LTKTDNHAGRFAMPLTALTLTQYNEIKSAIGKSRGDRLARDLRTCLAKYPSSTHDFTSVPSGAELPLICVAAACGDTSAILQIHASSLHYSSGIASERLAAQKQIVQALFVAVAHNRPEAIALLLDKLLPAGMVNTIAGKTSTLKVNKTTITITKNDTPLMLAAKLGHEKALTALLKLSPQVNDTNAEGDTAAHIAAKAGHAHIVTMLSESGCDISIPNNRGETVAMIQSRIVETVAPSTMGGVWCGCFVIGKPKATAALPTGPVRSTTPVPPSTAAATTPGTLPHTTTVAARPVNPESPLPLGSPTACLTVVTSPLNAISGAGALPDKPRTHYQPTPAGVDHHFCS